MAAENIECLVCGNPHPKLLDTEVELDTAAKVIRRRLVACDACGTVRIYRVTTKVEDLGPYEKRYLRADSTAR